MKPSFCAIANQQTGEDLIGTAGHYSTYVLIECPMPWAAKVFTSKTIPAALRECIKAFKADRSVQFLAVNRGIATSPKDTVTLMVYERRVPSEVVLSGSESIGNKSIEGYRGYEFQLDDLTQVADCLKAYWQGDRIGQPITQQDILVCTHGMRDKCCARFGQPFFREAKRSAEQGKLPNTRVWKVSHIGGHRFAPTAITLPDGRYYGRLTLSSLQSIVMRTGSVNQLQTVYRGWGVLPAPLQVLERQLLLQYGWSWFDHTVSYRILTNSSQASYDQSSTQRLRELLVEMSVLPIVSQATVSSSTSQSASQSTSQLAARSGTDQPRIYQAKLTQDTSKTVCTKVSCSSAVATPVVQYVVAECVLIKPLKPDAITVSSGVSPSVSPDMAMP